ncbi:stearoyl-CoA desaturase-like [Oppia nitens]|uniref:stearoyl-CoA desaturase-like n=1 Tax=Oppia nitens TaxID=1686743 RepID=UPI0023DA36F7|nr:stearoyl-CoA desaturase-like [Oppia nitens]
MGSYIIRIIDKSNVRYIYNTSGSTIVWTNVFIFLILNVLSLYGIYVCIANKCWMTWCFAFWYGLAGGLGVTAGAHRLWSHRSYKARLPLRIVLMLFHSIAGQNDLYEWCRDHRVHHKYSETDADPHNSKRGFFFAHVGWLLTRKHPDVIIKGKQIDLSDLINDPVVYYHKKYYIVFYLIFCFILPIIIPLYVWSETVFYSVFGTVLRYVTSLHCTWFVNSAAHMFGDKPYNPNIEPRENLLVSYGAFGEGFHNYHHSFPFDYSTSEMGWRLNFTTFFIDFMALIGQAYDMKRLSKDMVCQRKLKVWSNSY